MADERRFTWKETRSLESKEGDPMFEMRTTWFDLPIEAVLETERLGIAYLEELRQLGIKAAELHK